MPRVSVIIPIYNRAHLLSRAIKSLLNQTVQDFSFDEKKYQGYGLGEDQDFFCRVSKK